MGGTERWTRRRDTGLHSSGFTLVEILIVSLLLMILGGGLLTAFLTGQTSYLSADAYIQVQQEARRGFDNMVREIREAGNVSTTGTQQLNFQIARGYNNEVGCQSPASICWGSENALGQWVHYTVIGAAGNQQLIRCTNTNQSGAIAALTAGCRVLANNVKDSSTDAVNAFTWSAVNSTVIINLEVERRSNMVAGGGQTTGVLTSRVRLRNP